MFAVCKYSSYLCIMKSSLRKTHNDVNAYGIPETFAYNEDQIVSRDIVGETHGSIFDATQTMCCLLYTSRCV